MQARSRRSSRARLLLISAALASLIGGYYLGQYWQRQPLAGLSALVYPDGKPVPFPVGALPADGSANAPWRIVLTASLDHSACLGLLRHFALVRNRLAAWPDIQPRMRLTVLDYTPPEADRDSLPIGDDWVELLALERIERDRLATSLGILPDAANWCTPSKANSILVAPDLRRWALLPYEAPAAMARNIASVIQFVE